MDQSLLTSQPHAGWRIRTWRKSRRPVGRTYQHSQRKTCAQVLKTCDEPADGGAAPNLICRALRPSALQPELAHLHDCSQCHMMTADAASSNARAVRARSVSLTSERPTIERPLIRGLHLRRQASAARGRFSRLALRDMRGTTCPVVPVQA